MLPGDPNVPGQNIGTAFRATEEQKANPNIYGASYANDPAMAAFYGKNGLVQPDPSALQAAEATSIRGQNFVRNLTLGAAAVATGLVAPVLGLAAVDTCLANPGGCTGAGVAAGEVAAGPALGPTGMGVGNAGSGVRASETAAARAGGNGGVAAVGSVADANFAQSTIRASEIFSKDGIANYSQLAGRPINTVDNLAAALQSGGIKPSQLPVDYVVSTDGTKLILNTRTSVALDRAGVPKSEWYGTNQTGMPVPKMPGTTFDDLAADQLANNKLPSTGTPSMPKGKK